MWIPILFTIAVIIVIFLIVVAMRPSDFRVERSANISAPPASVFAQVNDFHRWENWSPWAKLDPNSTATYSGPDAGNGAKFGWVGNSKVGAGSMTIIDSQPVERVKIQLDFFRPFKGTNTAEFTFTPQNDQTHVTWAMYGKANFISKAFCMFMNQDKMLGGFFEKGLAAMKSIVEAGPRI